MRAKTAPLRGAVHSYLLAKVKLSPKTKAGYLTTLTCFIRWLSADIHRDVVIADLTAEHVNAYLTHLLRPSEGRPKGKARMAHNTALDVKAFANWLVKRGLIDEDQFDFGNVEIPKVSRDGRPTLADHELMTTLRVAKETGPRAYLAWTLILGHGFRLNELREAELDDFDTHARTVIIRGETSKSGFDHRIPLDPLAAEALDSYVQDYRPPSRSPKLLLTASGQPFTYRGFSSMFQRLTARFAEAGVSEVCAHRGRGVWATNADRKGYSLSDIKQMGGWRTDAMPLRYIKGKPMEELQRLPAPLASIVHDYELTSRIRGIAFRRTAN
jgi:integrase